MITCLTKESLPSTPWAIVANGEPLPINVLQESIGDRKILALDGAVNLFKSMPRYPDCILGDFDSIEDPTFWGISALFSEIDESSAPYKGNFGMTIIPAKDQNYTDLEKGIIACDQASASSILILQATGRRMDHTLGNVGLLRKHNRKDRELIIMTEREQILYVCNEKIIVQGKKGESCAILGYPRALMSTSGLSYDVCNYPLELGIQESISNSIADSKAVISIQGESLVILSKNSTFKLLSKE